MNLRDYVDRNGLVFVVGLEVESPTGVRGIIGPVHTTTFQHYGYVRWANGDVDKVIFLDRGCWTVPGNLRVVGDEQPGVLRM